MALAALLVTVASSAGWAGFDATRKSLAMRMPVIPLGFSLIAAQLSLFVGWCWFGADPMRIDGAYLAPGAVALTLNVLANLLLLKAFALAPLSLTIPFLSLTPALTALAGMPLLREWPSAGQSGGIGLVVVGALLLGFAGRATAPHDRTRVLRGSLLMILVAALWALTGPVDKIAMRSAPPAVHASVQVGAVAGVLLVLTLARGQLGQLAEIRRWPTLALVAAACGAGALAFQLLAMRMTLVSLVETIKRAFGLVGSVVNGRLVFGEPIEMPKLLAIAVMGLGVTMTLLSK